MDGGADSGAGGGESESGVDFLRCFGAVQWAAFVRMAARG